MKIDFIVLVVLINVSTFSPEACLLMENIYILFFKGELGNIHLKKKTQKTFI